MKNRILWLDNLKAFLILVVVLSHSIIFTENDSESNVLLRFIVSFQMPLFMFVSGFVSYKHSPSLSVISRRFKQCVIPFFIWSLIICLIKCNWHIESVLLYPVNGTWFLWALFWINSLVVICCSLSKKYHIPEEISCIILALCLIVINKLLPDSNLLAINLIALHFINFSIGYFSRKYIEYLMMIPKKVFLICSGAFFILAYFNKGNFMFAGLPSSLHVILDIMCGFFSFSLFVPFFLKFLDRKIPFVSNLGGMTLGIYVVHIGIFTWLIHHNILSTDMGGMLYALYVTILTIIVFFLTYVICFVIEKSRVLSKVLLGK